MRRKSAIRDDLGHLRLGRPGAVDPAAWFLGPKAENRRVFRDLLLRAFEAHVDARDRYAPRDPPFVTEDEVRSASYQDGLAVLRARLDELVEALQGSIPLASYRNQSHMYWDVTMPSLLGYISALFYNQNNVAAEASPITTWLEIQVAHDLCRMLGFGGEGAPRPWGHITCDGSVANTEAMWAARNVKFLPLAVAQAIRAEPELAEAARVTVRLLDGRRARLADLDAWDLLNLPLAEAVGLGARVAETSGLPGDLIDRLVRGYTVQHLGLVEFHQRFLATADIGGPMAFVPATAHYSWPKAASILGLGFGAVGLVPVDADGRMDTVLLRRHLDRCLEARRPVMQVVAVVGSTEESAVDPLDQILEIREEYREMGMEFLVHADGAWGAYFASMLRAPSEPGATDRLVAPHLLDRRPDLQLSDHVRRQIDALARADTVTLDPHKSGFVPYPAGGLCYRHGQLRELITHTAPVVYHDGTVETVGVSGVEGSKPGAAAAAVYLSHSVIPTDQAGYGRLLGRCIFNNKRFHAGLLGVADEGDPFTVTVFQRTPADRGGIAAEIAEERRVIRAEIAELDNASLIAKIEEDPAIRDLFRALGSDLSILSYAFNFRTAEGTNRDLALMNELNDDIFHVLSIERHRPGRVPKEEMFVTSSRFDPAHYGQDFVDGFTGRAGIAPAPGVPAVFLISTTQNPWLTDTSRGNFIPELMRVLRRTAGEAVGRLVVRHGLAPMGG